MPKYLFILLNDKNAVDYSGEWIGVAYISSYLKKYHIAEVDFLATSKEDDESVLKKCQEYNPDFIGLPTLTFNYLDVKRIVQRIKSVCPHIRIMLGHREATKLKDKILEDIDADYCIMGEGEITTAELVSAVVSHTNLKKVKGICYRDNGKIIKNEARPDISDLDSLPFPDRTIIAKGKYHNHVHYIISTRGCKGNCSFCDIASDLDRKKCIYSRSMKNIMEEMEELVFQHNATYIAFGDDSFEDGSNIRNMRYKELYEGLVARNLHLNFSFNARAESIKQDSISYLLKLKSVGMDKIFIGIDSGSEEDLRLYRKRANVTDNINAVTLLHEAGIPFDYGFIMFNPYTTVKRLKENIDFLERYSMDIKSHVLSHRFVLYTGAPMLGDVKRDNLLIESKFNKKDPFCYHFKNEYIEDIWNVLHPLRDWPANRDTISMVEGFIHSLVRDYKMDSVKHFENMYNQYLAASRTLFIKIFHFVVDFIIAGNTLTYQMVKSKFEKEMVQVKQLWDTTYVFNIRHGIIKEKLNIKG